MCSFEGAEEMSQKLRAIAIFFGGPGFSPQHPRDSSQRSVTGALTSILASMSIKCTPSTQAYMWAKHLHAIRIATDTNNAIFFMMQRTLGIFSLFSLAAHC